MNALVYFDMVITSITNLLYLCVRRCNLKIMNNNKIWKHNCKLTTSAVLSPTKFFELFSDPNLLLLPLFETSKWLCEMNGGGGGFQMNSGASSEVIMVELWECWDRALLLLLLFMAAGNDEVDPAMLLDDMSESSFAAPPPVLYVVEILCKLVAVNRLGSRGGLGGPYDDILFKAAWLAFNLLISSLIVL